MKTAILVLVEVLAIIGLSRFIGMLFRHLKQPLVIGEIIAGIALGPSLLGFVAPGVSAWLFPPEAIPFLEVLSEVGLIFFMFLIGLELNLGQVKELIGEAIAISYTSILLPFCMAIGLAWLLYPIISDAGVSFTAFTLFLGASLSITAFPVLARIITEKNLQKTRLGTLSLTSAAIGDAAAWCLLALAIAVATTNSVFKAIPTLCFSVIYIGLMLTVGQRFMRRLSRYYERVKRLNQNVLAGIFVGVLVSSLITELIGIHLIFGAFLAGVIMPKDAELTKELAIRIEEFVLIFLLPVFFAYSGLRTEIGLLNSPQLWLLALLVVGVAIAGKYYGTYFAARFSGITHQDAIVLGWLMNTRGLTELIVLNIGLSLQVISPVLFTILVIMALVTTFMTSPLLELTYKQQMEAIAAEPNVPAPEYRVLIPVANPSTQLGLVQLAAAIAFGKCQPAAIYPLSLVEFASEYLFENMPEETNLEMQARELRLQELANGLEPPELRSYVFPIVRVCNSVAGSTTIIAEIEHMDLILVGWHHAVFSNNRLGGPVQEILNAATTDVCIFLEAGRTQKELARDRLLVPYAGGSNDRLSLELAIRLLADRPEAKLQVLQVDIERSRDLHAWLEPLPEVIQNRIAIVPIPETAIAQILVERSGSADLTIAGVSNRWGLGRKTFGSYTDELATLCQSSLLITRKYNQDLSHIDCLVHG